MVASEKDIKLGCSSQDPPYCSLYVLELFKKDISCNVEWSKKTELAVDGIKLTTDIGIARYFARLTGSDLLGKSALVQAEIESWIGVAAQLADDSHVNFCLQTLEERLAKSKAGVFVGFRLTLADLYVWSMLNSCSKFKQTEFPYLHEFYDSIANDIHFKVVLEEIAKHEIKKSNSKEKQVNSSGEEGKFIELEGAEMGKVVVRFPPEASGYLHIGHAKAALLNQYYQQKFQGQLIMRFDDTNPAKENEHFEKIILEDLELLKIKPDRWSHSSDYFDQMLQLCEKLLREGKAYVDDTEPEQMKKEREQRTESKRRNQSPEENLRLWELMKLGSDHGKLCAVRMKIDMQSNNGCLRDPTIYRCKCEPHIRTGDKYKVYPTYDFACPIVDCLEGVTHALRTTEYHDRDDQYFFILDALDYRKPYIWEYCRLTMMNIVMSKRKLAWFVNEGHVAGWDDPRFPTIRGVMRRGMTIEGLNQFIIAQGSSRSVVVMDWDKIWSFNKKVIDPVAPRYTALLKGDLVKVFIKGQNELESKKAAKHPKNPDVGEKDVWYGPVVLIEQDDAKEMEQNQTVTFINWGNLKITKIKRQSDGRVESVEAELDLENKDYKKTMKVTWIADTEKPSVIPVVCSHYDHLISKQIVAKDEEWKDYINLDSEHNFTMVGEPEMAKLQKGDTIQIQRKGYYICDQSYQSQSPYSRAEMPCILINIPDGHVKEMPTAMKIDKRSPTKIQTKPANIVESKPKQEKPPTTVGEPETILLKIKEVGDKIREMKQQKAEKNVITEEVKVLNYLKVQYKSLSGQDWNPKLVEAVRSDPIQVQTPVETEKPNLGDSDSILLKIKEIGDTIRELKQQKAEKNVIAEEVKVLNDLKVQYKSLSGQDWNPKLVESVRSDPIQVQTPVETEKPNLGDSDAILLKIKEIGDTIRELKQQKAEKNVIAEEVKVLNDLKVEYKSLSGQDWNPKLVESVRSDPIQAQPPAETEKPNYGDSDAILLKIKEIGDTIRELKQQKAEKTVIEIQVEELLKLKIEYKSLTGNEWNPKLVESIQSKQVKSKEIKRSNVDNADTVLLKIKELGDKIRELKQQKAEKGTIDKEVKLLMGLKEDYKNLTGENWHPKLLDNVQIAPETKKQKLAETMTQGSGKKEKAKKAEKTPTKDDKKGDGGKKQTKLGLEVKKSENFADWYSQVITKAEMIEYYDVSGCYVLRPWSFSIWEQIQRWFDDEIKKLGVDNAYFPMFVSAAALEREKTHVADFAPEVAWVTKCGDSEMSEPVAIRPTSETVMYPSYAKWVQSHRDLPIRLNQWCNVVRWEFKHPTPFLRTREFLWQEGHSAFSNAEDAKDEVYTILDLYARIYTDLLAVPVIKGRKTEKEKFAGGDFTTTVECYIPANGRGVQGATSHHLGQNFSKMFDITFEDPDSGEKQYAYQNSWGVTTRTIGVFTMIHGDDNGLVLPPRIAKTQVIIIACGLTASLSDEDQEKLYEHCKLFKKKLLPEGVRADIDLRENYSPGWKYNHWELKGVPIRVELGPRDISKSQFVAVRRDTGAKSFHSEAELVDEIKKLLSDIHQNLYETAKNSMDSHVIVTENWDEFCSKLDQKCIIMAPFCGDGDCEDKIKKDSARGETAEPGAPAMGAKSLCIPFDQPKSLSDGQICVHPSCDDNAKFYCLFGRSY